MILRRRSNWLLAASCLATLSTLISPPHYSNNIRRFSLRSKCNSLFSMSLLSQRFLSSSVVHADDTSPYSISYLDAKTSKEIDEKLMTSLGFSIDQLMELAGLSVASAVKDFSNNLPEKNTRRVLIICGPGNNGGDGLVAARHLYHFGFEPTIVYPKPGKSTLFVNLVAQCTDLNIPILSTCPHSLENYDLVVDAIFGFSFHGPAQAPFGDIIYQLATSPIPVISVDLPSGWHVEQGDIHDTHFTPAAVVSLTAPKKCVETYSGIHYLGGRFLSPRLAKEYNITLPPYSGADQIIQLSPSPQQMPDINTSGWSLHLTEEGYPYYHHAQTQQSHWAKFQNPTTNSENEKLSLILSTASSATEAKMIASHLVKQKLVACVNIIPTVTSIYEWEGKVEESSEVQMIIKTKSSLIPDVTKEIKDIHSYSVPEVIAVEINGGNQDYLSWVLKETKRKEVGRDGSENDN